MSVSSSSAGPSSIGQCLVCGVETVKRCSPCAKQGSDWMYFCSQEHQKLVWFMHKRVCGERSNPFLWPKLTKSEVDKIVQVSEVPTPKFGSWLGKWSMNRFRTVDGGKLAFRATIEQVSEKETEEVDGEMLLMQRKNAFLFEALARITQREQVKPVILEMMARSPFNYLAYSVDQRWHSFGRRNGMEWTTQFLHLYVVYHAILIKHLQGKDNLSLYVGHTHSMLERFRDEVVVKTHPEFFTDFMPENELMPSQELPKKYQIGPIPWSPPPGQADRPPRMTLRGGSFLTGDMEFYCETDFLASL